MPFQSSDTSQRLADAFIKNFPGNVAECVMINICVMIASVIAAIHMLKVTLKFILELMIRMRDSLRD